MKGYNYTIESKARILKAVQGLGFVKDGVRRTRYKTGELQKLSRVRGQEFWAAARALEREGKIISSQGERNGTNWALTNSDELAEARRKERERRKNLAISQTAESCGVPLDYIGLRKWGGPIAHVRPQVLELLLKAYQALPSDCETVTLMMELQESIQSEEE